MQIALTKKLSDALEAKMQCTNENENPLFSWTANWTKVWNNHRTEDLIVLVNNLTRFTVAIYQVKRKDLINVKEMMKNAIKNTLLALKINPEIVFEYLRLAGEVEFTQNCDRRAAAWVTKAGQTCAFYVGNEYYGIDKMFSDAVGVPANYNHVNYAKNKQDEFVPYNAMLNALAELSGKPPYKYRAFELLVTLDLNLYKAVRRIIVPSDLLFSNFHRLLQTVFNWKDYYTYIFAVIDSDNNIIDRFVSNKDAILMKGHTLSDCFSEDKHILYTYDNWEYEIQLVQVIENYDKELPFLAFASGQIPPENVDGVEEFLNFRKILMDPSHPEHNQAKRRTGSWAPELSDWQSRPRVIHDFVYSLMLPR